MAIIEDKLLSEIEYNTTTVENSLQNRQTQYITVFASQN